MPPLSTRIGPTSTSAHTSFNGPSVESWNPAARTVRKPPTGLSSAWISNAPSASDFAPWSPRFSPVKLSVTTAPGTGRQSDALAALTTLPRIVHGEASPRATGARRSTLPPVASGAASSTGALELEGSATSAASGAAANTPASTVIARGASNAVVGAGAGAAASGHAASATSAAPPRAARASHALRAIRSPCVGAAAEGAARAEDIVRTVTRATRPSDRAPVRGAVPFASESGYVLDVPAGHAPPRGFPALVSLHGHGDDAGRMRALLAALRGAPYARLFLDAPHPTVMRDGPRPREGRTWYVYTGDQPAFVRALETGTDFVDRALRRVAREHPIDPRRAVLLGYSQGGYLAGFAALRAPRRWRGLVAIACRVKVEALEASLPKARGFPALLIHGRGDRSVLLEPQLRAAETLRGHGVDVEVAIHPGGHGLSSALVPRIDAFVRRALNPRTGPPPSARR